MPIVEHKPNKIEPSVLSPALKRRIRQQEMLAELGVSALQGASFSQLLVDTARLTAEGMQAEFCKVMEHIPTERCFLIRAGVGWEPGIVDVATIGDDLASPGGFAVRTGQPVISNHLAGRYSARSKPGRSNEAMSVVRSPALRPRVVFTTPTATLKIDHWRPVSTGLQATVCRSLWSPKKGFEFRVRPWATSSSSSWAMAAGKVRKAANGSCLREPRLAQPVNTMLDPVRLQAAALAPP